MAYEGRLAQTPFLGACGACGWRALQMWVDLLDNLRQYRKSKMEPPKKRRSDRITMELSLEISGDDVNRFTFVEKTRTAVVSRHGAKIHSQRKLGRDQEMVVRCLRSGKETEARVVGEIAEGAEGYTYGIEFLDPEVNIWEIEFPPMSQAEQAAGRTLLECIRCHTRELVYLEAMEVEVLNTGQGLSRICKRCTDMALWKVVRDTVPIEPLVQPEPSLSGAAPVHPETPPTPHEGKDVRTPTGTLALLRHPILGDEMITAEHISPSGLSFRSIKRYRLGALVEVALPYTKGGANIFVAARLEHLNQIPGEKFLFYGLGYLPAHEDWPRK
jgi:hypothetical protein